MKRQLLLAGEIEQTIGRLRLRIGERFPDSGLAQVCQRLHEISQETDDTIRWIKRPHHPIRAVTGAAIAALLVVLGLTIRHFRLEPRKLDLPTFIQMTEAGLNELILIGAGVVFIVTFETRRKRARVIRAINTMRSMAHVVDAHQLTKDPSENPKASVPTDHSPKRVLTSYELIRYLDYCSEMLSLMSKVGFLYVQDFDDPVASDAVNDLESLTNGLSRKIWQKIMILHQQQQAGGGVRS
ncbi:MAG: hypothetical protein HY927_08710 [Elusimicrobia bacterium]|nr:hypothetical protein [Elusimicrobiota bacterium]